MNADNVFLAFALTLFAGLSTGIGSAIAFFTKHTNKRLLSVSLGFSAGVMIYISFMEMMPQAQASLVEQYGSYKGQVYLLLSFFGGMGLIQLIDILIPEEQNPHEMHTIEDLHARPAKLKKTGMMLALSIAVHNFPEGIATFASAMSDVELAIPIAIAIAIHNIPEGIAVSVPIYQATGKKSKAFALSFLSGMAEPLGALIGFLFLMPYWTPSINGVIFAAVSGIMVFISMDELLPSAQKYGEHHYSITGMVTGMVIMAISLLFL